MEFLQLCLFILVSFIRNSLFFHLLKKGKNKQTPLSNFLNNLENFKSHQCDQSSATAWARGQNVRAWSCSAAPLKVKIPYTYISMFFHISAENDFVPLAVLDFSFVACAKMWECATDSICIFVFNDSFS